MIIEWVDEENKIPEKFKINKKIEYKNPINISTIMEVYI